MAFKHRGSFTPQAPPKDPNSRVDYSVDWSKWLSDGETIVESSWIVLGKLQADGTDVNGSITTVWLLAGAVGVIYKVTNRIITSAGRIEDRSMNIRCLNK